MSDTLKNPPRPAMQNMMQIISAQEDRIQELERALASQPKPAPVLLTDEEFSKIRATSLEKWAHSRAIESAVLRKQGWGV